MKITESIDSLYHHYKVPAAANSKKDKKPYLSNGYNNTSVSTFSPLFQSKNLKSKA
ncbi:hypothetical protein PPEP_b0429 [Pseudoalteromonas peptidolytica F12-50-A1]|uniref:Uncharacterized protein n=1 Tax=Pseudoalteromonas peptidolytica F12-50-A1 TaxID=1315280 RepID=A0A8I0MZ71_9GAMM|nr:hypothetical protein [Pseudoalteromonas peptidolytica F12-50-A1]